eukprot:3601141-Rhodomonas_salina.3
MARAQEGEKGSHGGGATGPGRGGMEGPGMPLACQWEELEEVTVTVTLPVAGGCYHSSMVRSLSLGELTDPSRGAAAALAVLAQ